MSQAEPRRDEQQGDRDREKMQEFQRAIAGKVSAGTLARLELAARGGLALAKLNEDMGRKGCATGRGGGDVGE